MHFNFHIQTEKSLSAEKSGRKIRMLQGFADMQYFKPNETQKE